MNDFSELSQQHFPRYSYTSSFCCLGQVIILEAGAPIGLIIAGVVCSLLVVVAVIFAIVCVRRRKRNNKIKKEQERKRREQEVKAQVEKQTRSNKK